MDRYLAAYMADKIGATFAARVSGVARFGLFVTLHGSGASGLVPVSALPDDYWMHDETTQSLHGRRTRQSFRLAQEVRCASRGEPGDRRAGVPHHAGSDPGAGAARPAEARPIRRGQKPASGRVRSEGRKASAPGLLVRLPSPCCSLALPLTLSLSALADFQQRSWRRSPLPRSASSHRAR